MKKAKKRSILESKFNTKVILTFSTGEKISTLLPRKAADAILDQINDPFYDNVRSIMLLSIGTAGMQSG